MNSIVLEVRVFEAGTDIYGVMTKYTAVALQDRRDGPDPGW